MLRALPSLAATGCPGTIVFAFCPLFPCNLAKQSIHSRRKVNKFIVEQSSYRKVSREGGEAASDQIRGAKAGGHEDEENPGYSFFPGFRRAGFVALVIFFIICSYRLPPLGGRSFHRL